MVRLNKTKLTRDQLEALFNQFSQTFIRLDADKTELVLSEILGPEEKIMLAKRLAIIVLLLEGKSLYQISELLKVSSATAKKMRRGLEKGNFKELVSVLGKNKSDYFKILNKLDKILHLGGVLPHYNGIRRHRI
jgi:uncharacterized protein YerC